MDPDNAIVRLCAEGMQAESVGDLDGASARFQRAWNQATSDWEKCVAAHYVARHQMSPEATLHWNEECLRYAEAVGDETVAGFYPSLYLNIGHSHEVLGNRDHAIEAYQKAVALLHILPPGPYADMVKDGVTRGLERMGCPTAQGD
jgi:tetratricopeptide (TPR) repeat protein